MIETDGIKFLRKLAGYHAGLALIATIESERDYHLSLSERFAAEELSISDRVRIDIEARRLADTLCRRADVLSGMGTMTERPRGSRRRNIA